MLISANFAEKRPALQSANSEKKFVELEVKSFNHFIFTKFEV